jgi:hypothetical protein
MKDLVGRVGCPLIAVIYNARMARFLVTLAFLLGSAQWVLAQPADVKSSGESKLVRVPFVGCASDGQVGPMDAPQGVSMSFPISPTAAKQLAFYQSANGPGVLGPRGWHCFGTYGSSGDATFISPEAIDDGRIMGSNWKGFSGPAIEFSRRFGDTSGRFDVAGIMARVFPGHEQFVQRVVAEKGLVQSFESGPYPADKLTYRGKNKDMVEFKTPPNSKGLGTEASMLQPNSSPVSGVAILFGSTPDLLLLQVRLPAELQPLANDIIHQTELGAAHKMNAR